MVKIVFCHNKGQYSEYENLVLNNVWNNIGVDMVGIADSCSWDLIVTLAVEEDNAKFAVAYVDAEENIDEKLVDGGPCARKTSKNVLFLHTVFYNNCWIQMGQMGFKMTLGSGHPNYEYFDIEYQHHIIIWLCSHHILQVNILILNINYWISNYEYFDIEYQILDI